MLTDLLPQLKNSAFARAVSEFFRSGYYLGLAVALMVCSELFGLELPVYYTYVAIVLFCLLFSDDMLGAVPLAATGYMTFSAKNLPDSRYDTKPLFAEKWALTQLIILIVLAAVILITRLVYSLKRRPRQGVPRLSLGFLLLGLGYLFAGAFTPHFGFDSFLFGFIEIVSLCFFYFYFYFTVDWEKLDKEYILRLFLCIGFGVAVEIVGMYFNEGVFVDGLVVRSALHTGWGSYNPVACVMAMCIPAPLYFAATHKNGWAYNLVGIAFYLVLCLAQSRGGILFGSILLFITEIAVLIRAQKRERIYNAVAIAASVLLLALFGYLFRNELNKIFQSLIDQKFNSSGRIDMMKDAWRVFTEHPFFGVGWWGENGEVVEFALEFMYNPHNYFLNLLMVGGIVLFILYWVHRLQTLTVLFKRPASTKTFVAFSVLALLLTSLLDTHFFSMGTGILYSVLLLFAEGIDKDGSVCEKQKRLAMA